MNPGDRYIECTFSVSEEEGGFSSVCSELDIASCGDTLEEAISNLQEAVSLTVDVLREDGVLTRVLREKGVRIKTYTGPVRPRRVNLSAPPDTWTSRKRVPIGA